MGKPQRVYITTAFNAPPDNTEEREKDTHQISDTSGPDTQAP